MEQVCIQAFDSVIDEFISNLILSFPYDMSFRMIQSLVYTMKSTIDTKEGALLFWNVIKKYKKRLDRYDDSFIYCEKVQKEIPRAYQVLFDQLRDVWARPSTSPATKRAIFDYIKQMARISEMISKNTD